MKNPALIKELLIQISKGDTNSFRLFYERFFQKVWHIARCFNKSEAICEEIVSDVFIGVWLNKEKLPEIQNIEAYLYIVTRNKAFNYYDKADRIPMVLCDSPVEQSVDCGNPEDILISTEMEQALQKSIMSLPERCRIIFQLSRDEQLTHRQIAEMLSISENTVHAQMVTALKKLYDSLKKYMAMLL